MTAPSDSIYALASAPGRSGIAVIRVSGPQAGAALLALGLKTLPQPRRAVVATLHNPKTREPIDRGIVLYFKAPDSFTGEDVAELHVHGGRAVVLGLYEALGGLPGLALAEPGAFTKRAFMNGKMDLTEAEAIADLIAAETAAQRRQALRQMDGALGRLYESWRTRLIRTLAHVEADLDFPDEDLPQGLAESERTAIRILAADIAAHLADNKRGERLRQGYSIAILGAPNAGKSSLLNALAEREAAIVSPIAGTTRDVIEVSLDLGGYPVICADTAGLRASHDPIEQEGIRRAYNQAERADLCLVLFDATAHMPDPDTMATLTSDSICLVTKSDLAANKWPQIKGQNTLAISALRGHGLDALTAAIVERIGDIAPGESLTLTRARHRQALERCFEALERSLTATETGLIAEDLRLAAQSLGKITGKIDVEDVLDVVFRDFCIGK